MSFAVCLYANGCVNLNLYLKFKLTVQTVGLADDLIHVAATHRILKTSPKIDDCP